MVGTIEPRKGHLLVLEAFERLWEQGRDINLVIVGHEGWKPLPDEDRRTIPEIVRTIRGSAELGRRLFWLEGVSDEYLDKVYAASDFLIAASEDEGFGLPLIEAARHGVPVIARDIPVFREIGCDSVAYFSAGEPDGLFGTIRSCLDDKSGRRHEGWGSKPWMTWRESAAGLAGIICADMPSGRGEQLI
jgi:glycosyltransferase involved in cell wall biosynthesis